MQRLYFYIYLFQIPYCWLKPNSITCQHVLRHVTYLSAFVYNSDDLSAAIIVFKTDEMKH